MHRAVYAAGVSVLSTTMNQATLSIRFHLSSMKLDRYPSGNSSATIRLKQQPGTGATFKLLIGAVIKQKEQRQAT